MENLAYLDQVSSLAARRTAWYLVAAFAAITAKAQAESMADYFNSYGTTQTNLHDLIPSGGTGWAGDWTRPRGGTLTSYSDFLPGEQVNPVIPGYESADNANGFDDGAVGEAANTHNYNVYRATPPLDGTIWISAAYYFTGFGIAQREFGPTVDCITVGFVRGCDGRSTRCRVYVDLQFEVTTRTGAASQALLKILNQQVAFNIVRC